MQHPILLEVPKPCHEDWNNMTAEGRGRFCGSCSKQVVDFSLMSDQQILNHFSKASGKTCGRFSDDQLKRPLLPVKEQKKQTWWMAMMLPLLFFVEKSNAQKKKDTRIKGEPAITRCEPKNEIMGKVAFPVRLDTTALQPIYTVKAEEDRVLMGNTIYTIRTKEIKDGKKLSGKIINGNGEPVPYAYVHIGDYDMLSADSSGNFSFYGDPKDQDIDISITALGYENKSMTIDPTGSSLLVITLTYKDLQLQPVTVTANALSRVTLGGAIGVRVVRYRELIDTSIRKILRNEIFKTYPNPVSKGSMMSIQFKIAGEYSIQILDNSSRLVEMKEYNAMSNAAVTTMAISSTLSGGIYYVRVIDEKKKKQYTDKIIVE